MEEVEEGKRLDCKVKAQLDSFKQSPEFESMASLGFSSRSEYVECKHLCAGWQLCRRSFDDSQLMTKVHFDECKRLGFRGKNAYYNFKKGPEYESLKHKMECAGFTTKAWYDRCQRL